MEPNGNLGRSEAIRVLRHVRDLARQHLQEREIGAFQVVQRYWSPRWAQFISREIMGIKLEQHTAKHLKSDKYGNWFNVGVSKVLAPQRHKHLDISAAVTWPETRPIARSGELYPVIPGKYPEARKAIDDPEGYFESMAYDPDIRYAWDTEQLEWPRYFGLSGADPIWVQLGSLEIPVRGFTPPRIDGKKEFRLWVDVTERRSKLQLQIALDLDAYNAIEGSVPHCTQFTDTKTSP